MSEVVLPRLSTNDVTAQLPMNPSELLNTSQHQKLIRDLASLADLRRDAETESASLRLA